MKKILLAMALALAFLAAPAHAAPPNRDATLVVNPTTPVSGDALVFSGCGYEPGMGLTVVVVTPAATTFFGGPADADGCYTSAMYEYFNADVSGEYTARAYQSSGRRPDATLTFVVAP